MLTETLLLAFLLANLASPTGGVCGDESRELRIIDATGGFKKVGGFYRNRFDTPSRQQAEERLQALREKGTEITVRDFLGGELETVAITFLTDDLTWEEAEERVRNILDSVILSPERLFTGPELTTMWSEPTRVAISARLYFTSCQTSYGVTAGDGLLDIAATDHIFLQDLSGIYWWHRWYEEFPRRELNTATTNPKQR